jgi:hypothetical protein
MRAQEQAAAAAAESQRAAFRLFRDKALTVVQSVSDSLRIHGKTGQRFAEAIDPTLADLFRVQPLASSDQIRDALMPHVRRLDENFMAFLYRLVPTVKPAVDSLRLVPQEGQLFTQALLPVCQDAFMVDPDMSAEDFRVTVNPLLERARFFFDSVRAAAPRTKP